MALSAESCGWVVPHTAAWLQVGWLAGGAGNLAFPLEVSEGFKDIRVTSQFETLTVSGYFASQSCQDLAVPVCPSRLEFSWKALPPLGSKAHIPGAHL